MTICNGDDQGGSLTMRGIPTNCVLQGRPASPMGCPAYCPTNHMPTPLVCYSHFLPDVVGRSGDCGGRSGNQNVPPSLASELALAGRRRGCLKHRGWRLLLTLGIR